MTATRPIAIRPIEAEDLAEAARLHAGALDTGWTEDDLRRAIEDQAFLVRISNDDGRLTGLIAARIVADEAELLSLVVDSRDRNQGIGQALCEMLLESVSGRGVRRMFLEVAEDNAPAVALYGRLGFIPTGRRRGYYTRPGGSAVDAVTMTCHLDRMPTVDGLHTGS